MDKAPEKTIITLRHLLGEYHAALDAEIRARFHRELIAQQIIRLFHPEKMKESK